MFKEDKKFVNIETLQGRICRYKEISGGARAVIKKLLTPNVL